MWKRGIAGLALALVTASGAGAQSGAATKAVLQQQYSRWVDMYRKREFDKIGGMTAMGFTWKTDKGKVLNGKAAMALIQQQRKRMDPLTSASIRVDTLAQRGNSSVAVVTETYVVAQKDKAGKPQPHKIVRVAQHTWVKQGSAWKLRAAEVQRRSELVNGKPVKKKVKAAAAKAAATKPAATNPGKKVGHDTAPGQQKKQ